MAPADKGRRPTITDVAHEAGVSVSAVSKVLCDSYGVSDAMREKVNRAIEVLGYRPQAGARAMRGKTFTIGVVLADIRSPWAPVVIEGVEDELSGTPYEVVIGPGGPTPDQQMRSVQALLDRQVDGLVLLSPSAPLQGLEELARTIPLVVIARHGPARGFDSVVDDDVAGAALMVDHLVGLGHTSIAHISHPSGGLRRPSVLSHTARADGYIAAMKRHGLEPVVITTSYTEDGGYQGALEALRLEDRPTAIFAGADIAAMGVLRAAHELGLRVPEDLTVTGYDNTDAAAWPMVSLTTVDQSGRLTGAVSARMLMERIDGRTSPVTFSVSPSLIVRSTSATPFAMNEPAKRPRRQAVGNST